MRILYSNMKMPVSLEFHCIHGYASSFSIPSPSTQLSSTASHTATIQWHQHHTLIAMALTLSQSMCTSCTHCIGDIPAPSLAELLPLMGGRESHCFH